MVSRNFLTIALLCTAVGCVKPKNEAKKATVAAPTMPTPSANSTPTPTTPTPAGNTGLEPIAYPLADAQLGEVLAAGEVEAATEIASVIDGQIRAQYPAGKRALRDAHPKTHGCLRAEWTAEPGIKEEYAQGVFAKGSKYNAIIRFSNSSEDPSQPDITKDGRGMAFKLLNVPGPKLLENESQALSQDFIMISHPVFFIKDPAEYVTFIKKFQSKDILSQLATAKSLGVEGVKIASAIKSLQISSPIQAEYFSNVPYQLGVGPKRKAVKFNARPCAINGKDSIPTDTKDANYLRTRLVDHFKIKDACMEIFVQERTDDTMSVEDSRIEWKTPWTKVATLTMKKEAQDIPAQADATLPANVACDTLSFNPWHSLAEHKPLGSMNRIRKSVYEHISKLRHELNKEVRKEPDAK